LNGDDMQDSPLTDIRIGKITSEWAKARSIEVIYKPQLASTSTLAKEEAFKESNLDQNIVLYLTDHQTQGRGRQQNSWHDGELGSSLLSSWSFFVDEVPVPVSSPRTGLALFRAAFATWPYLPWSLKAPNDLFLGDKKVAGLLLETVSQGDDTRFIIGLGMNITTAPKNIGTATSLVAEMPEGIPLLGEDWIGFLDRLFFEFSLVIERQREGLNETEAAAVTYALNLKPGNSEKYLSIAQDGTIQTSARTISWAEL
jgi:BirA family biotin operon repressor/biotin-[acetyl-CoA-carboxylase] ligase